MRSMRHWRRPTGRPERRRHDRLRTAEGELVETLIIDVAVDAYADWREESTATGRAYRRWTDAGDRERSAAFASYARALDREQRAADLYAAIIGH
jgi:hypothetical protein